MKLLPGAVSWALDAEARGIDDDAFNTLSITPRPRSYFVGCHGAVAESEITSLRQDCANAISPADPLRLSFGYVSSKESYRS